MYENALDLYMMFASEANYTNMCKFLQVQCTYRYP